MLVGAWGRWNPNSINFISERQRGQVHIKLERSRSSAGPFIQPDSSRFQQRERQAAFGRLAGCGGRPGSVPIWHCRRRGWGGEKVIQMFSTEIAQSRSQNLKFLPISNSFHEMSPVNSLALSLASCWNGPLPTAWLSPAGRSVLDTAPSKHRGIGRCPSPHSAVSQVISELGLQIWNFSCLSFSPHLSDLTHKGTGTCYSLVQGLQASVLAENQ